jgi:hypothetical protein
MKIVQFHAVYAELVEKIAVSSISSRLSPGNPRIK